MTDVALACAQAVLGGVGYGAVAAWSAGWHALPLALAVGLVAAVLLRVEIRTLRRVLMGWVWGMAVVAALLSWIEALAAHAVGGLIVLAVLGVAAVTRYVWGVRLSARWWRSLSRRTYRWVGLVGVALALAGVLTAAAPAPAAVHVQITIADATATSVRGNTIQVHTNTSVVVIFAGPHPKMWAVTQPGVWSHRIPAGTTTVSTSPLA